MTTVRLLVSTAHVTSIATLPINPVRHAFLIHVIISGNQQPPE